MNCYILIADGPIGTTFFIFYLCFRGMSNNQLEGVVLAVVVPLLPVPASNYLLHVLVLRLALHLAPFTLFNTLQQSLFAEQGSPFCLQVTGS